ncbi:hypothetical protein PR048_006642 [Dryococelus australis]|uniref:DDE-1 domain-containing protein n=1 Tax=Dryococelus australis TaxID=614101 RepID=A0ABQ9IBH7_9NEOP|nr:hypothetical protein PR048_006642 [Dryococelus australis]
MEMENLQRAEVGFIAGKQGRHFLNRKNLSRKVLLAMDNCPSHPDSEEMVSGEIKTIFLPPNITPFFPANGKPQDELQTQAFENSLL